MKKIIIAILLLAVFIAALGFIRRQRPRFDLADGSELELFYLDYGDTHEFDLRSMSTKAYELIPYTVRNKLTWLVKSEDDWAAMGPSVDGSKSLGIGLRREARKGSARDLQDDARWILSDDSGWYFSGWMGSIEINSDAYGALFAFTPRDCTSLTLSMYSTIRRFEPDQLLGSISIPNAAYDARVAGLQENPVPAAVSDKDVELKRVKFWTGISLPEMPAILAARFDVAVTDTMTSGIEALLNGDPVAAEFPHRARTALVFEPYFHGASATQTLRNVRFTLTDASGNPDSRTNGVLFRAKTGCALVMEYNLPTNSGNYEAELTLYEDPPVDAAWVEMPPITPGASDVSSTRVLALGTNIIHAGMSLGNNRIDFTATEDPSLLAVRAMHTETSQPLQMSPLQDGHWSAPYWCYAELAEPVTTGTVTLQFARTTEHKVKFSGVPERAD